MRKRWIVGAQLSTSHSPAHLLTPARVADAIDRVTSSLDLDILVVGAEEIPELFCALTDRTARRAERVFLWYNLLSDIPDMQPSDLVVNWRGERSRGWAGWEAKGADVCETFRFACPNNPRARQKTLARISELLARYPFDGVFLDKMRFPSPANGIHEVISCFCGHCRQAAAHSGLDLDAVAERFERGDLGLPRTGSGQGGRKAAASWIHILFAPGSLVARFFRFRCDSINRLVAASRDEVLRLGRTLALDLFSPSLAPFVGQEYPTLSQYCAWAKPMTYRTALGPASLRLEIPALADGLAGMLQAPRGERAARALPGISTKSIAAMRANSVPLPIVTREIAAAVRLMDPVPVYFGLELVRYPGVIEITPALVNDMVVAGRAGNAAGTIISWDIMHAPEDGIRALGAAL
jgi:hypothetical protein